MRASLGGKGKGKVGELQGVPPEAVVVEPHGHGVGAEQGLPGRLGLQATLARAVVRAAAEH